MTLLQSVLLAILQFLCDLVQFQIVSKCFFHYLFLSSYITAQVMSPTLKLSFQCFKLSSTISYIQCCFEQLDHSSALSCSYHRFQYSRCLSTNLHQALLQCINTLFQCTIFTFHSFQIVQAIQDSISSSFEICLLRFLHFCSYSIVQYFIYNISSGLVFFRSFLSFS